MDESVYNGLPSFHLQRLDKSGEVADPLLDDGRAVRAHRGLAPRPACLWTRARSESHPVSKLIPRVAGNFAAIVLSQQSEVGRLLLEHP